MSCARDVPSTGADATASGGPKADGGSVPPSDGPLLSLSDASGVDADRASGTPDATSPEVRATSGDAWSADADPDGQPGSPDASSPDVRTPVDVALALPTGPLRIPALEAVTRLARVLWKSAPDQPLLDAAAAGRPSTIAGARATAQTMIDDANGRDVAADFVVWWLGLERVLSVSLDARANPTWSPAVAASMLMEARLFTTDVVFRSGGRLATLFDAPYTFADQRLRQHYGVLDPGSGFQKLSLGPVQHAGLLTQGAVLVIGTGASLTSPTKRGLLVRERMLCQDVPPQPIAVPVTPPADLPGVTRREEYQRALESPTCGTCHRLFDPVGFAFENYDAVGRYRTLDNGRPVDASAEIVNGEDASGSFRGAQELARKLATAEVVRRCFSRKWLEYALGRPVDARDSASVNQIVLAGEASGWDIKRVIVEAVVSPAFLSP